MLVSGDCRPMAPAHSSAEADRPPLSSLLSVDISELIRFKRFTRKNKARVKIRKKAYLCSLINQTK